MEKMINVLNQLQQNFNIPGMENVDKNLQVLISKARRELAANTWLKGKYIKQLIAFYNVLDNLNQQWPQIKQLFADGELSPQDQIDLNKLLVAATKDNVFQSLARAFRLATPFAPGLDPGSIVKGIMNAAATEGGIDAVSKLFQKAQALPGVTPQGEPKLGGQPTEAEKAGQTTQAKPAGLAKAAGGTETTTGAKPGGTLPDNSQIAKDIAAKAKIPEEQVGNYEAIMNLITKYGYKIVPK